jgi:nitrate/nitrite transporter NarK
MSMPQVHIVAYCGDLGYGVARGAEMLSLMLGFGIVSRIASGFIADRIGGLMTLLLGSVLQALALFLYMLADGLTSLYVISALFGLFQGGIVPMYAIIVRQYFSPKEVGIRIGIVLMATLFGMAAIRFIHRSVVALCHASPEPHSAIICSTEGTPMLSKKRTVASSGCRALTAWAIVVFPEPDAPVKTTNLIVLSQFDF